MSSRHSSMHGPMHFHGAALAGGAGLAVTVERCWVVDTSSALGTEQCDLIPRARAAQPSLRDVLYAHPAHHHDLHVPLHRRGARWHALAILRPEPDPVFKAIVVDFSTGRGG